MKKIGLSISLLIFLVGCAQGSNNKIMPESAILYKHSDNTSTKLYFIDSDGSHEFFLQDIDFENNNVSIPIWSIQAELFFFVITNGNESDIYSVDIYGRNLKNLTNTPTIFETNPKPSPNGKWIVYEGSEMKSDIWIMDVNGRGRRNLTESLPGSSSPIWAYDNNHIYFSSVKEGTPNIFQLNINDGELVNLSRGSGLDGAFSVSNATQIMVFDSDRNRAMDIFLLNLITFELTNLTNSPYREVEPTISPDGQKILYKSNSGGGWDYYYLDLVSHQVQQLTNEPQKNKANGIWGDKSNIIYFNMEIEGYQDLFMVNIRNPNLINLTNTMNINEFAPKLINLGLSQ